MHHFLSFFFILFLLYSCSSTRELDVDYDIPAGYFMVTPEGVGKLGSFELGAHLQSAHDIELGGTTQTTGIFSTTPGSVVIDTDPNITSTASLAMRGSLGLHPRLEIMARRATQGVWEFGPKFQFLGKTDRQSPGWVGSLFLMGGYSDEDENSEDTYFDGGVEATFDNVEAYVIQKSFGGGIIFGRRFSEETIVYTNLNYNRNDADSSVNIQGGTTFDPEGVAKTYSAIFGMMATNKISEKRSFNYQFELGYSKLDFSGVKDIERSVLAGALGLSFSYR